MNRDVVICRDINELKELFKKRNLTNGLDYKEDEEEEQQKPDERIFKLPNHAFEDFKELDDDNEDDFEYLCYELVINWLEKCCHLNDEEPVWNIALMFPDSVPSKGRSILHDVGNYFKLAHHTTGRKDSVNRKILMYPKTMFLEKQQRERLRLIKERENIRAKYKNGKDYMREPREKPTTFRE